MGLASPETIVQRYIDDPDRIMTDKVAEAVCDMFLDGMKAPIGRKLIQMMMIGREAEKQSTVEKGQK